jgi:hypothetical protein
VIDAEDEICKSFSSINPLLGTNMATGRKVRCKWSHKKLQTILLPLPLNYILHFVPHRLYLKVNILYVFYIQTNYNYYKA